MSAQPHGSPTSWLMNRPYLLLSLASLSWAGNVVVGRFIAGQIPPGTLSFLRWTGAFLIVLPFAWSQFVKDWPTIRRQFGLMVVLSLTGVTIFNTLLYWGLEYTQALNALLLNSTGPLFVAVFSLLLFGIRLTWMQGVGIVVSMLGVLVILLRGDLEALRAIRFNTGDVMYIVALAVFGLYSALAARRPKIDAMSFLAFTCGCGAVLLVPVFIWEIASGRIMTFSHATLPVLAYVMIFPSTLAYMFFNRGVELIGANRGAPFLHLIPVFGSVLAIVFLGERLRAFHLAGYALVLTGVFIAARRGSTTTAAE